MEHKNKVSKKLDSLGVSDCYSFLPLVRENNPQIKLGSPVRSRLQPLMQIVGVVSVNPFCCAYRMNVHGISQTRTS